MKTLILFILFTITLHNCKDYKKGKEEENKFLTVKEKLPLKFSPIIETRADFIFQGKNYTHEYKLGENIIRVATKNFPKGFYNEIYSDGALVGKLQTNSWTTTPYYYKNKNIGLLFIEEGDEGGIWGYSIFLVKKNKIKEIGFIDVSSSENSPLNKFLSLIQEDNFVLFNFLESNLFSNEKIISTSEQIIKIDINTLKIIKTVNDKQSNNINLSFNGNDFIVNFEKKSTIPKSDNIYFENNFLIINKTIEENNPHNTLNYKFYFTSLSNNVTINKIDFTKQTYVEQDDICKLSYTYVPKERVSFSPNQISVFKENDLDEFIRKINIKQALELVSTINKNYQCTSSLNEMEIDLLLKEYPLDNKTINDYNNIAYFLEQNKEYKTSLYLLDKILYKYPDRVVAWLNYADAQWGLDKRQEAKNSYQKYVSLMNSQSKDLSKIPQRVKERME